MKGLELVSKHAYPSELENIKFELSDKYFTTCAAAACLEYAMNNNDNCQILCNNHLRFKLESTESCMVIDSKTLRSLELIQNKVDSLKGHILLKLLNSTQTPMGARILKSNILQPLTNVETLNLTLDWMRYTNCREKMKC